MPKPKHPLLVFAVSLIPGAGHVLLGQAQRGLMFIFFMTILGWISTEIDAGKRKLRRTSHWRCFHLGHVDY